MDNAIFKFILLILSLSLIKSSNNYNEIEYISNIYYRMSNTFSKFSVKFNKNNGIQANFHETKPIYYGDSLDVMNIIDYKPKTYNFTNEELGIMPMKELFKNFNKITFPEENDCSRCPTDIPFWHLLIDGKDYYANKATDYTEKVDNLVHLDNIRDYVEKIYYNK